MIKLKMHSIYDNFPYFQPLPEEPYIDVYSDHKIEECTAYKPNNIALLLEPRSLLPDTYKFVSDHLDRFRYIFTHDSVLLNQPNARLFLWCDVWHTADVPKKKDVSLVSSWKDWCELHKARLELARYFDGKGKVDCYGSFKDKEAWTEPAEALDEYRFSIVLENDLDEYWFTEKLLNCFATKTIPIYVGASRIGEIFNTDGIIQATNWKAIPEIVRALNTGYEYEKRLDAVNDNFERVKAYKTSWKDRFISDYKYLLEGLLNEQL